jgi:hypothetical protein
VTDLTCGVKLRSTYSWIRFHGLDTLHEYYWKLFQKNIIDVSYHVPIVMASFAELSLSSDYHVFSYFRSSLEFMGPKDSSPYSQQTVTGPQHMLDKSSSHNPILFPLNHSVFFIQICVFFLMAQQPYADPGLVTVEVSRSHSRHISLGSTPLNEWQAQRRYHYLTTHKTHETDIHAPSGIRNRNLSKLAVAKPTP